jgi:hypothetical protein
VNFIGHATVALWHDHDGARVLGSMLPDFAGMASTRLSSSVQPDESQRLAAVREGIALHHRTDEVFHATPIFVSLQQETLDALVAQGISRGTARAVAHVGTEMFIDGVLVHGAGVAEAYTRALNVGDGLSALFANAEGAARWELLRQRLIVYGAPYDYGDPESVLRRLSMVLRGRPRLAIDDRALPILRQALPGLQRKVVDQLPALLSAIRVHLS